MIHINPEAFVSEWYVVRTRNELRTRDDLAERGFYGYVPVEQVRRRLGRKLRTVERAVWRGYVFVLCGAEEEGAVLQADGAADFVRRPQVVDYGIVAMVPITLGIAMLDPILRAEWAGELDYASREDFVPQLGDRVLVRSGKWKGFLGRIVALSKHKMTVEGDRGPGRLQVEPEHLSQAPEEEEGEQHLAA